MNTSIISGTPSAFVKSLRSLIEGSPLSVSLGTVSFSDGALSVLAHESSGSKHLPGSVVGVEVFSKDPVAELAAASEQNPYWQGVAVFPKPADSASAKKKPGFLLVAVCLQP